MNTPKDLDESDADYALSSLILYSALTCSAQSMTVDLATTIGLSLSRSDNFERKNKEIKNGN